MAEPFRLTEQFQDGLRHCKWAGRNQVVERGNVVYYLDGAHTPESVVASAQWFHSEMQRGGGKPTVRVLLFNTTGSREAQTFLQPLMPTPLAQLSLILLVCEG
jgi:folylpolyglutamate synthase